ncbi:MAG: hypothetical protein MMC23_006161 [Stictis urceolatum]|nr:hypothetical protein [Stictis urceolata]
MALIAASVTITTAASGTGTTTRYWDCCKPSCAWNDLDQLGIESAVTSCDINDNPLSDTTSTSGCESGGTAYMCSGQSPWAVSNDLAYGFAAVSASSPACCQCYQLTFTSTSIAGKKMIVQATNTGSDVGSTQFDIAMPGGGFGIFDGCTNEWGATSEVWGAQYGGSSTNTCPQFPSELQPGCGFRWDWFGGADNPTVEWEEVACPSAITAKSGCVRKGDTPVGPSASSSTKVGSSSSAPAAVVAASSNAAPESAASSLVVPEVSLSPLASSASVSVPTVSTFHTTFAIQTASASSATDHTSELASTQAGTTTAAESIASTQPSDEAGDDDTCEP